MSKADHDPLWQDPIWYDRVEPGEAPGTLLRITGLAFAGLCAVREGSRAIVGAAIGALGRSRLAVRRVSASGWSSRGLLRLFD